mmetsp:Transcript_16849/g.23190  ORF Transcript_16849/g.23190 Transcript_16849/m.23190 type:complete len:286 (-) Transcript_16849:1800-2657(-)
MLATQVFAELLSHKRECIDDLRGSLLAGGSHAQDTHSPPNYRVDYEEERTTAIIHIKGDAAHATQLEERFVSESSQRFVHRERNVRHAAIIRKSGHEREGQLRLVGRWRFVGIEWLRFRRFRLLRLLQLELRVGRDHRNCTDRPEHVTHAKLEAHSPQPGNVVQGVPIGLERDRHIADQSVLPEERLRHCSSGPFQSERRGHHLRTVIGLRLEVVVQVELHATARLNLARRIDETQAVHKANGLDGLGFHHSAVLLHHSEIEIPVAVDIASTYLHFVAQLAREVT